MAAARHLREGISCQHALSLSKAIDSLTACIPEFHSGLPLFAGCDHHVVAGSLVASVVFAREKLTFGKHQCKYPFGSGSCFL